MIINVFEQQEGKMKQTIPEAQEGEEQEDVDKRA